MTGAPAKRLEPQQGRARPPHSASRAPQGDGVGEARGAARRQQTGRHAVVATSCARHGHSPSSAMIASGGLMSMEGILCICW